MPPSKFETIGVPPEDALPAPPSAPPLEPGATPDPLDPEAAPEEELPVPGPGPPGVAPPDPDPEPAGVVCVPEEVPPGAPEPPLEDGGVAAPLPLPVVEPGAGVDVPPELEDPPVGAGVEPDEFSPEPPPGVVSDEFDPEQAIIGPMTVNNGSNERRCRLVAIVVLAFRVVQLRAKRRSGSLFITLFLEGKALTKRYRRFRLNFLLADWSPTSSLKLAAASAGSDLPSARTFGICHANVRHWPGRARPGRGKPHCVGAARRGLGIASRDEKHNGQIGRMVKMDIVLASCEFEKESQPMIRN